MPEVGQGVADEHESPSATDDLTQLRRAEAEAVAAETQAVEARARADELRQRAVNAETRPASGTDGDPDEGSAPATADDRPARVGRRRRPEGVRARASVLAVVASIALLATSGYISWFQHIAERDDQRRAEFAAAASRAVITLMSIDSANAAGNVEQILAESTGQFRDDFHSAADDFVKAAQDSQAATEAAVHAAAVESMTSDSAVVLVTAATTVSTSAGADQQPRNWRLSVTMLDDGTEPKLSKVEFIP